MNLLISIKRILKGRFILFYNRIIYCLFILFLILINALIIIDFVSAEPPLPTEFYGTIYSYNQPAVSGVVKAYVGNISCGQFSIVNSGYYGVLSCLADDPSTSEIEGGIDGQVISFRLDSNPASAFGDIYFSSGNYNFVNITFPELICGDGFCDRLENCYTCEADCFTCNATSNQTGNATGNVTNNATGGGTPSGSGSGSGGAGGAGGGGTGGAVIGGGEYFNDYIQSPEGYFESCNEDWNCTDWSECSVIGLQNRTCNDKNNCGTYKNKPAEVQECSYEGNCFDGLINCHDGLCEEGVDCGGPCEKKCSLLEQPIQNITIKIPKLEMPKETCERKFDFKNIGFLIFILILLLSILIRFFIQKVIVEKLRKNEDINALSRSRRIIGEYRKTKMFIISIVFLSIGFLFYSYFFLLCPNIFFKYSWLLLLFIIIAPLAIYALSKSLAYNEKIHLEKQKHLDDMHYQNLMKLIEMENRILSEEENIIANKLYELSKNDEAKEIMFKYPDIKKIYNLLMELYDEYSKNNNPFDMEKDFCDRISKLRSNEEFIKRISAYPEMKEIFERLEKLYHQYDEKQKLYDELNKSDKKQDTENSSKEKLQEKKDGA
ncbi:MAG: hypothetical protein KatS3mg002_1220 [Candidatus Woesearchaeota archaeon]|nr:MAG: hypothetical protein KatS3mg002_1220 [Candidatus Woesearchaeota archaeon]